MKNKPYFKISVLICVTLFLFSGKCSEKNGSDKYGYKKFEILLERANLIFIIPKEYGMVEIIKNKQVDYNLAFKTKEEFEIRYTIIPYDSMLIDYNAYIYRKSNNIKIIDSIHGELLNEYKIDPNELYKSFFMTYLFNISEKSDSSRNWSQSMVTEWDNKNVSHDFNADYGVNTWCKLDPEFGQKYKYCNIYMIHKKNCGAAFCYILFKEMPTDYTINNDFYMNYYYNIQFYKTIQPAIEHPKGVNRIFKH